MENNQPNSKLKNQTLNKNFFIYIGIILLISIVVILAITYYYSVVLNTNIEVNLPSQSKEDMVIKKQLEELEKLRQETEPLSEQQIQNQVKELDKIKNSSKPLTEKEIQSQIEELEKLRSQQ
jgi:preprotein translocase subunit SecF